MTQVMNLLNLTPDNQEEMLTLSVLGGKASVPERALRRITSVVLWTAQRKLWQELIGKVLGQR